MACINSFGLFTGLVPVATPRDTHARRPTNRYTMQKHCLFPAQGSASVRTMTNPFLKHNLQSNIQIFYFFFAEAQLNFNRKPNYSVACCDVHEGVVTSLPFTCDNETRLAFIALVEAYTGATTLH